MKILLLLQFDGNRSAPAAFLGGFANCPPAAVATAAAYNRGRHPAQQGTVTSRRCSVRVNPRLEQGKTHNLLDFCTKPKPESVENRNNAQCWYKSKCKVSQVIFGPTCSTCFCQSHLFKVSVLTLVCCWFPSLLIWLCLSWNIYRTTSRTKNWHLTPLRKGHSTPSLVMSVLFLFL